MGSSHRSRPGSGGHRDRHRGQLEQAGRQSAERLVGVVGEAEPLEHLGRVGHRPAGATGLPLREAHVVGGSGVGQQVAVGPLQHQADLGTAQPVEVARRRGRELGVSHEDLAGAGAEDAGQQAHQGRLARAGRPQEAHHLAGRDIEVDARQRGDVVPLGVVDVHQAAGADRESGHQAPSLTRSTWARRATDQSGQRGDRGQHDEADGGDGEDGRPRRRGVDHRHVRRTREERHVGHRQHRTAQTGQHAADDGDEDRGQLRPDAQAPRRAPVHPVEPQHGQVARARPPPDERQHQQDEQREQHAPRVRRRLRAPGSSSRRSRRRSRGSSV